MDLELDRIQISHVGNIINITPDILTPRVSSGCGRGSGEDRKPVLKFPDVAGIMEGLLTEAGAGCEKECLPPLTFLAAGLWCWTGPGAVRALWSLSFSGVGSLPPAIVTPDRPGIGQDSNITCRKYHQYNT